MDYMKWKAVDGFDDDLFLLMTSRQMERDLMELYGLLDGHMHRRGDLPPLSTTAGQNCPASDGPQGCTLLKWRTASASQRARPAVGWHW